MVSQRKTQTCAPHRTVGMPSQPVRHSNVTGLVSRHDGRSYGVRLARIDASGSAIPSTQLQIRTTGTTDSSPPSRDIRLFARHAIQVCHAVSPPIRERYTNAQEKLLRRKHTIGTRLNLAIPCPVFPQERRHAGCVMCGRPCRNGTLCLAAV